jgi:hypothetical protein
VETAVAQPQPNPPMVETPKTKPKNYPTKRMLREAEKASEYDEGVAEHLSKCEQQLIEEECAALRDWYADLKAGQRMRDVVPSEKDIDKEMGF